jgi:hypothetical protein
MSSFIKLRPVGAELLQADRPDMTKLTVAFRNSANAPKKGERRTKEDALLEFSLIAKTYSTSKFGLLTRVGWMEHVARIWTQNAYILV